MNYSLEKIIKYDAPPEANNPEDDVGDARIIPE